MAREESWYFLPIALGYGSSIYTGNLQILVDDLKKESGVRHTALSMDMLGLYLPVFGRSTIGIIASAVSDSFTATYSEISVSQYIFGPSYMTFLGKERGSGLFFRVDAGMGWVSTRGTIMGLTVLNAQSRTGYGALAGGGYGFAWNEETRLLLTGSYSFHRVPGLDGPIVRGWGVSLGLFL